jgi:hypothetical protein
MAKKTEVTKTVARKMIKRPGVHAKTKTSGLKTSRNYRKLYKGQGR